MTTVKWSDIKLGKNIRKALGDIPSVVQDIKAQGLADALVIQPDGVLVRGYRRYAAMLAIRNDAQSLNISPLPYEEVEVTIKEFANDNERIYAQLIDRGEVRKNLTNWETCCALYELRKSGTLSYSEIAERVNFSTGHVQRLVNVREIATKEVIEFLDRGVDPPLSALFGLVRVSEERQLQEIKKCLGPENQKRRRGPAPSNGLPAENLRGRTLRRAGPINLKKLMADLQAAMPEEKVAVNIIRYLLGQTDRRPVPRTRSTKSTNEE